jgi:DNA invertase Pin-like site-specific DNA recombinase
MLLAMTAAVKYLRISEDRDDDERGITRQRKDTGTLAAARDLTVVEEYADNDLSATFGATRPRYTDMMAAAARGEFSVIIVFQLSRLWRNRRERAEGIEVLRRAGVSVVCVKGPDLDMSTAYGRGMTGLLGEFDTMEAEVKGERTVAAQRQAAEAGLHLGGARPFGWDLVPDPARAGRSNAHRPVLPVINETEAAEVRRLTASLLAGDSLNSLARDLNDRGILTTRGKPWTATSLRVTLTRPRNYGAVDFQGEIIPGAAWPAIVAETDVRRVRRLLENPGRRTSTGNRVTHLMSGLALCGVEGCTLRVKTGSVKSRNGNRRRLYKCPAEHLYRAVDPVDVVVEGALIAKITLARLSTADAARLLGDDHEPDLAAEAATLREKIAELLDMWESDELTRGEHKARRARLTKRLDAVTRRMERAGRAPVLRELLNAEDVAAAYDALSLDRKRAAIAEVMEVTILPGVSGRTYRPGDVLDEERVGIRIDWVTP